MTVIDDKIATEHVAPRSGAVRAVLRSPVLAQLAVLVIGLAAWEIAVHRGWASGFLIGWPSGIAATGWKLVASGDLAIHAFYTLFASALGFVIGTAAGTAIGLGLWYSAYIARVLEPFLVAINSVPKIAFAPMVILWFGTGLTSKVALSVSLTLIVALLAAFQSAREADPDLQKMMASLGCTKWQIFTKVVVPSSLPHVIGTFHINIGFALVGTVVGEFISSRHGVGHIIFVASSLYDLNTVWVGIIALMLMGFMLSHFTYALEARLLKWKDKTFAPSFGI